MGAHAQAEDGLRLLCGPDPAPSTETTRTHVDLLALPFDHYGHFLYVRQPATVRAMQGVTDIMPKLGFLAAYIALGHSLTPFLLSVTIVTTRSAARLTCLESGIYDSIATAYWQNVRPEGRGGIGRDFAAATRCCGARWQISATARGQLETLGPLD